MVWAGGSLMVIRQDYTFWRIIHNLVLDKEYRVLQISPNQQEVWLESSEKHLPNIIRILRHDLDWGNWMQHDMERTLNNVENVGRKLGRKNIDAVNIYVSTYPPVDNWRFRLEKPLSKKGHRTKTVLQTFLLHADTPDAQDIDKLTEMLKIKDILDIDTPLFDSSKLELLKQEVLVATQKRIKMEQRIFQNGKPFFTYFFITLQLLMFFLLEISGGSTNVSTLIKFGAKENSLIIAGEWWRFFTPIILHIGFFHLVMNTLALYFLGSAVERIFGRTRFLVVYLLAGFSGSLASFIFSPVISAGASGAIFGCFGALLYFGFVHPKLFFRTMGSNVIAIILLNLAFGFIVPGIDNAGHIGGLIGGFLASSIIALPNNKAVLSRIIGLVVTIILIVALLNMGYNMQPNP